MYILKCPTCQNDDGILIPMQLSEFKKAAESFETKYQLNTGPCENCTVLFDEYKTKGFIFFIIDGAAYDSTLADFQTVYDNAGLSKKRNMRDFKPTTWQFYRGLQVMKRERVNEIFSNVDDSHGFAFLSIDAAEKTGLWPINPTDSDKKTMADAVAENEEKKKIADKHAPIEKMTKGPDLTKQLGVMRIAVEGEYLTVETDYLFKDQFSTSDRRIMLADVEDIENDHRPHFFRCNWCGHKTPITDNQCHNGCGLSYKEDLT